MALRTVFTTSLLLTFAGYAFGDDVFPGGEPLKSQLQRFDDWVGVLEVWAAEKTGERPALDGYCPVRLKHDQVWALGQSKWTSTHNGKTYFMAGKKEHEQFLANPKKYAAFLDGDDLVERIDEGCLIEGVREHGLFYDYKGETLILLFSSEATLTKFALSPDYYLRTPLPPVRSFGVVPDVSIVIEDRKEPRVTARDGLRMAARHRKASEASPKRSEPTTAHPTEAHANEARQNGAATSTDKGTAAPERTVVGRKRILGRLQPWRRR